MEYTLEQKVDIIFSCLLKSGMTLEGLLPQHPLKATASDKWIDEKVAAAMLSYQPRTLRTKVKSSLLPIGWRVNPTQRGYQYNIKDIINYKNETSTEI